MIDNKALNRAEIIAALRCCGNTDTKRPDCEHCPLNGYMCVKRMLEGAADLLERGAEEIEQLRSSIRLSVWINRATDEHYADILKIGDALIASAELQAALTRVEAERDAANRYLEKIDGMFGTAYPNEILAVLEEWRGAQGEE